MTDEQPKIIVDSDWKSEAQAEKERLVEAEQQATEQAADVGGAPVASFEELLRMLVMPALMYMGQIPDPQSGKAMVGLDVAKMHIDLLGVIEEKTKGNLTDDEAKALNGYLQELRMIFVEVTKAVAQAMDDGTLQTMDPNATPPMAE